MSVPGGPMTAQQFQPPPEHISRFELIGTIKYWWERAVKAEYELSLSAHNTAQLQKEGERTKGYDAVLAEVGKLQGIVEAGDAENVELQAALEVKEKELTHFRELQNVDPYQYAPGNCCGDAHMSLQFALEAIKEIGFEVETREGENLTEIIWHNKRAETAEAELERLRSQGAGQWEAALRKILELKHALDADRCTNPSDHAACLYNFATEVEEIVAGLASPPEGKV